MMNVLTRGFTLRQLMLALAIVMAVSGATVMATNDAHADRTECSEPC